MPLKREQAEAAGWTLSKGGTNASNHAVGVYSVRPTNVLSAITAIESYPACVERLKTLIESLDGVVGEEELDYYKDFLTGIGELP